MRAMLVLCSLALGGLLMAQNARGLCGPALPAGAVDLAAPKLLNTSRKTGRPWGGGIRRPQTEVTPA